MTIPLVPPSVCGAVTQLEVGEAQQFGCEAVPVKVELSTKPSAALPTPKNIRSVMPSKNSVSGEHSSPRVLLTTQPVAPVEVVSALPTRGFAHDAVIHMAWLMQTRAQWIPSAFPTNQLCGADLAAGEGHRLECALKPEFRLAISESAWNCFGKDPVRTRANRGDNERRRAAQFATLLSFSLK